MGIYKFITDHTYDIYLPYLGLGTMLLFPGIYYTVIFIGILMGAEGYEYDSLPDLSEH